jgi:nucleotide-binding universal stress UspA family protein
VLLVWKLVEWWEATMTENPAVAEIVVGVDGSGTADLALAWAVREAGRIGARVRVLCAWHYVPQPVGVGMVPPAFTPEDEARAAAEVATLAASRYAGGPVPVVGEAVEGTPWRVLVDASHGAELLVVGSRGHSPFVGALLGSVAQHCVTHAACPVVVMPPDARTSPSSSAETVVATAVETSAPARDERTDETTTAASLAASLVSREVLRDVAHRPTSRGESSYERALQRRLAMESYAAEQRGHGSDV